jgi:Na+-translocating ferredoxin:NAD+ oxidoreductase RnfD subunit
MTGNAISVQRMFGLEPYTRRPGGRRATHTLYLAGVGIPIVLVKWSDARWAQIICLGSFNILGQTVVDFRVTQWQVVSGLLAAIITEMAFMYRQDRVVVFPASALISGLGIGFLFRSDTQYLHAACGFLSIASKYVIKIEGKHLYNPTNFGICLLLLLFPDNAWITAGQWGTAFVFVLAFANAGLFVGYKVRRFHVCVAWFGTLAALVYLQAAFTDLPADTAYDRIFNGALVIYTFFMITDPKTSPNTWLGRVMYASGTAVLTFILMVAEVRYAAFFALFFTTSFVPLVDRIMSGDLFEWETERELSKSPQFSATGGAGS